MEIVSFVPERCRAEGRDPSGFPAAAPSTSAPAQPRKEVTRGAKASGTNCPLGGSWGLLAMPPALASPLGGAVAPHQAASRMLPRARACARGAARASAHGWAGARGSEHARVHGWFCTPQILAAPPRAAFPRAVQRCGSGGRLVLGDAVERSVLLARAARVKSHPDAGTRALPGSSSTGGAVRVSVPLLGRRTDGHGTTPRSIPTAGPWAAPVLGDIFLSHFPSAGEQVAPSTRLGCQAGSRGGDDWGRRCCDVWGARGGC